MDEQRTDRPAPTLSLDTFFRLLSDRWRRVALSVLASHDRKMTVNDVTKEIVSREYEAPITDVPREEVIRIYSTLHHNHIPRLAETPLIRYDPQRTVIEPTEMLVQLGPLLSTVAEADSVQSLCDGTRSE